MRSLNRCSFSSLAYLSTVLSISCAQIAGAQVVYSVGTQQVYDTNIFLEDDKVGSTVPVDQNGQPFEQADGELNSDFISNPYVSLAGKVPGSSKIVANYNARLGFILYNENSQQNRLAVDGTLSVTPREDVLPQYYTLAFNNTMSSQAGAVGVAQGAAAQQGQINVASISGGLQSYRLNDSNAFSNLFSVSRQDFLDQFNLSSSNENERFNIPGVDSFTYAMNTRIDHTIDSKWSAFISNNLNYFDVTGGEFGNSGSGSNAGANLDRVNISPSVGGSYVASSRLQFTGSTGVDFSRFSNEVDSTATGIEARESTQTSIFFGGSSSYVVSDRASLGVNILQSAGTDINGGRLLSRSFGVNGNYIFNNRLSGNLSGQLAQFTLGDSLSKPIDRYSVTAATKYSLTEAIALSVGYSFVVQSSDAENTSLLFNNGDYDGHRAFVSLDTGFLGFLK
jgi:hypothetical protein